MKLSAVQIVSPFSLADVVTHALVTSFRLLPHLMTANRTQGSRLPFSFSVAFSTSFAALPLLSFPAISPRRTCRSQRRPLPRFLLAPIYARATAVRKKEQNKNGNTSKGERMAWSDLRGKGSALSPFAPNDQTRENTQSTRTIAEGDQDGGWPLRAARELRRAGELCLALPGPGLRWGSRSARF